MISFVYFDVGGVAVIDFSGNNKWDELKAELGITTANEAAFDTIWERYRSEICLHRDVDTLVPVLRQELGLTLPKHYSLLNGFVSRFEKNSTIWPIIEAIKRSTPAGLLTNMYPHMLDGIIAAHILPPVAWDVIVDSSIEGCQKPEISVFERATDKTGFPKEHILFVDNSAEHVAAAQAFGMQTFLYDHTHPDAASDVLLTYFEHHK